MSTELDIGFTEEDYLASEGMSAISVGVFKSQRIATPVTVSVSPLTLTQYRATGRPDLPGIPPDDIFSPIEAGMFFCHCMILLSVIYKFCLNRFAGLQQLCDNNYF